MEETKENIIRLYSDYWCTSTLSLCSTKGMTRNWVQIFEKALEENRKRNHDKIKLSKQRKTFELIPCDVADDPYTTHVNCVCCQKRDNFTQTTKSRRTNTEMTEDTQQLFKELPYKLDSYSCSGVVKYVIDDQHRKKKKWKFKEMMKLLTMYIRNFKWIDWPEVQRKQHSKYKQIRDIIMFQDMSPRWIGYLPTGNAIYDIGYLKQIQIVLDKTAVIRGFEKDGDKTDDIAINCLSDLASSRSVAPPVLLICSGHNSRQNLMVFPEYIIIVGLLPKLIKVVDTPGILGFCLEDINTTEMQAITDLEHFCAVFIYVMDVLDQCDNYIEQQVVDTPGILGFCLEDINTTEVQAITDLEHFYAVFIYEMEVLDQCDNYIEQQTLVKGFEDERIPLMNFVNKFGDERVLELRYEHSFEISCTVHSLMTGMQARYDWLYIWFIYLNEHYKYNVHRQRKDAFSYINMNADHTRWEPKGNIHPPKIKVIPGTGSCDFEDQYESKAYIPDDVFSKEQTSEKAYDWFLFKTQLSFVIKLCLFLGKMKSKAGIFLTLLCQVLLVCPAAAITVERNSLTMYSSLRSESLQRLLILKENQTYSDREEYSKDQIADKKALLLCTFLLLNTVLLVIVLVICLKCRACNQSRQHMIKQTEICGSLSTTGDENLTKASCTFSDKNDCQCKKKDKTGEHKHYYNVLKDGKEVPIPKMSFIFLILSLAMVYIWTFCICLLLKYSTKKQKETVASTSELGLSYFVISICMTWEILPISGLEKTVAVLNKVKTKQECTLFSGRINEREIVIKLQLAHTAQMMRDKQSKPAFLKKHQSFATKDYTPTKNNFWQICSAENECSVVEKKHGFWDIPVALAKTLIIKRNDETCSEETVKKQPSENIRSCLMKTYHFLMKVCRPYEEFDSTDKTQNDSSKMGMNKPGIYELCFCGLIYFMMTKVTIGIGQNVHKKCDNSKPLAICEKPHNGNTTTSTMTMKIWTDTSFHDLHTKMSDISSKWLCPELPGLQSIKNETTKQEGEETDSEDICQAGSQEVFEADGDVEAFSAKMFTSVNVPQALGCSKQAIIEPRKLPKPLNLQMLIAEKMVKSDKVISERSENCHQVYETKKSNNEDNGENQNMLKDAVCRFDESSKEEKQKRRVCEEARILILYHPEKRKNSEKDEYSKRRRLEGVTSKPSDDDCDYCEILQAVSLQRKRPINADIVFFLIDLLHILRKRTINKVETGIYRFSKEDEDMVKEFFVEQECAKDKFSRPIHKDLYLMVSEDDDSYALPGKDYELHLPLIKLRKDEQVTSNSKYLSNDSLEVVKKDESKHQNSCEGRHTLDFGQLNEKGYRLVHQKNERQTSKTQRLSVEVEDEQNVKLKQIKLVVTTADSRQSEHVTDISSNVKKKAAKIQIQVSPNCFVSQSDVGSISKKDLQEAFLSTDRIRYEPLRKWNYRMSSSSSSKKFFEIHDNMGFSAQKQKFGPSEDIEEALYKELKLNLPQPEIDTSLLQGIVFLAFEPLMSIIDQIANGTPPTPHISMRYELLRFCTLRSYPKENKPYLIKLAEAGFYYASDGDGVVCYCCGVRRYNWVAEDNPMKIHERINPNCKYLRKNEEVNVPVKYFGPFSETLMAIMDIPEPRERPEQSEDVNNDWAPERIRSPAPAQQNRQVETGANSLGINTAVPKHTQYATKTAREGSYSGWPDSASHTPQELADAGFFYAGFGDCVRCFYCGIGLRHWTKEDNPWIEHARWSRNCVFVKQKKGEEFINLVQLAVQYSQDNEAQSNSSAGNQLQVQEIERILLSDAAQSVLEMGYQPRIIKKAIEQILGQDGNAKITAQVLMEKVLEIEEAENQPQATPAPTQAPVEAAASTQAKPAPQAAKTEGVKDKEGSQAAAAKAEKKPEEGAKPSVQNKDKKETKTNSESKELSAEDVSQDPKAIKAENEQLKEQTLCKVCLDNTVCIVFLPCGHLVTCADCAPAMRKCPICRALVKGTVRTYMS